MAYNFSASIARCNHECLLKQVFSSSNRELKKPWKAGIFNSTQWSSLKLASAILIEAHVFKSLSQNHAWEIRSQILCALSTCKITKSKENAICPWLTLSALLLSPTRHLIWYNKELSIQSHGIPFFFFFNSFSYLCRSTRMLGRRFSFWAPNFAKALTAAIMEHKMKQHEYWLHRVKQ